MEKRPGRHPRVNADIGVAGQFKFWLRSVFVPWRDFVYRKSEIVQSKESSLPAVTGFLVAIILTGGTLFVLQSLGSENIRQSMRGILSYAKV